MNNQKLPDTPWHLGYAKKEKDDPRRHKAWCIHRQQGNCYYGKSPCYGQKCFGSSHCRYYAKDAIQAEKVRLDTMTIEEEAEERALKYREKKIREWNELKKVGADELRRRYGTTKICPICSETISKKHGKCMYCGFTFNI